MKFYFEPKHAVIQNIKQKMTGAVNRHLVCSFDENGEFETEDPKIIFILQNKLHGCTWDGEETVEAEEVQDILSDDDIRQLAKDKGVKSWHVKKIDNIKKELEELEG